MEEIEIWKPILGYGGLYEVSNFGRIKSLPKIVKINYLRGDLILKGKDNGFGYLTVGLSKEKKCKRFYIHRLVAIAFVENKDNKPQVNHIDGDKTNNNILNLEWCNNSENGLHAYRILKRKTNGKMCYQYDRKGNLLNTFISASEASRQTGINKIFIASCCIRRPVRVADKWYVTKSAGGYDWSYELK